jgi:hypothetical protein
LDLTSKWKGVLKMRKGFIVLICVSLLSLMTSCGGGNDSPGPDNQANIINATNAEEIIAQAILLESPALDITASNFEELSEDGTLSDICLSGSVDIVHDDVNGDGLWSTGENVDFTYNNCMTESDETDTTILYGKILLSNAIVDNIGGTDDFVGTVDIQSDNFQISISDGTNTINYLSNGTQTLSVVDNLTRRISITATNFSIEVLGELPDYVPPITILSGINSITIDFSELEVIVGDDDLTVDGTIYSSLFDTTLEYQTIVPFDEDRLNGELIVTAQDNTKARYTVNTDSENGTIEIDSNGDNTFDNVVNNDAANPLVIGGMDLLTVILLLLIATIAVIKEFIEKRSYNP